MDFFKKRGHTVRPSSSLIPDDPSVLFTTAGMQQFKPYFTGEADPMRDFGSLNTVSIQKSMRTSDIDEVGDESHLTFFEMLGHFSFGDYFKKETIKWTYELLTEVFNIESGRISATVFAGDEKIPFDSESYEAWSKFLPSDHIRKGPRKDNIWGPAGAEGPCGAANEVYVDDLEVATLVFMEYFCAKDQSLTLLPQKGVDVGWGFERLVMLVQKKKNIFETDLFEPTINAIKISEKYDNIRVKRIIADHIRAAAFLISDGVLPSNKEQGYVLRRLMRRIIFYGANIGEVIKIIVENENYAHYKLDADAIIAVLSEEKEKFSKTLEHGLKELEKQNAINAKIAFDLYQTYGLPYEIIKEVGGEKAAKLKREDFDKEFARHQEISKAGQEKKFGGHGLILDTGELKAGSEEELQKVTRLHTATHLLQAALREVLGKDVKQMGSDITPERARFDFSFGRKLTSEELKKIESLVNKMIEKNLNVKMKEMDYEEAVKSGALSFFKHKYPKKVKVYSIGVGDNLISRELCGGPHVAKTGEIGKFSIIKEEAVASGVRRVRAVIK